MLLQGRKPMIVVIVWLPNLNKPIFNLNDGIERVKLTYVCIMVSTKKICIQVVNLRKTNNGYINLIFDIMTSFNK